MKLRKLLSLFVVLFMAASLYWHYNFKKIHRELSEEVPVLENTSDSTESMASASKTQESRTISSAPETSNKKNKEKELLQLLNAKRTSSLNWVVSKDQGRITMLSGGAFPISLRETWEFAKTIANKLGYYYGELKNSEEELKASSTSYVTQKRYTQEYEGYAVDGGFLQLSISHKDSSVYVINNELQPIDKSKVKSILALSLQDVQDKIQSEHTDWEVTAVTDKPVYRYVETEGHILTYKFKIKIPSRKMLKVFYDFYSTETGQSVARQPIAYK